MPTEAKMITNRSGINQYLLHSARYHYYTFNKTWFSFQNITAALKYIISGAAGFAKEWSKEYGNAISYSDFYNTFINFEAPIPMEYFNWFCDYFEESPVSLLNWRKTKNTKTAFQRGYEQAIAESHATKVKSPVKAATLARRDVPTTRNDYI